MSNTTRRVSHRLKKFYGTDKVRDGSATRHFHSCENHGGCSYCLDNRMHKHLKQYAKVRDQLKDAGL